MANVLNRTTKQFLTSQNTPDFDPAQWIISPDLSAVAAFPSQYWTITGDVVTLMNVAQRNAVDDQSFIDQMTNLSSPPDQIFGDGSDGDMTIGSDTTLTQDIYPNILAISATFTLFPAGFRIIARRGIIIRGSLRNDGADAVGATGGAGAVSGTIGGGGAGITGIIGIGGAAADLNTNLSPGYGGAGGNGGTAVGGTIAGGLGGLVKTNVQARVRPRRLDSLLLGGDIDSSVAGLLARFQGGAGGGAGAGAVANAGGGGGGGAGLMVIVAPFIFIDTTGLVTSRGGAAGNSTGGNAGGGGGGGGGVIFSVRQAVRNRGSFSMAGGAAGNGTGTGANGTAGSGGRVVQFTTVAGS
jgi:hypothetical protein